MITLTFVNEWPVHGTSIAWQQEGRRRLNIVVRLYNRWQVEAGKRQFFDTSGALEVLALVEEGKQTWARQDGGESWLVELDRIESLVRATGVVDD